MPTTEQMREAVATYVCIAKFIDQAAAPLPVDSVDRGILLQLAAEVRKRADGSRRLEVVR